MGTLAKLIQENTLRPTAVFSSNPMARIAAQHRGMVKLGRAGWATKGVVLHRRVAPGYFAV